MAPLERGPLKVSGRHHVSKGMDGSKHPSPHRLSQATVQIRASGSNMTAKSSQAADRKEGALGVSVLAGGPEPALAPPPGCQQLSLDRGKVAGPLCRPSRSALLGFQDLPP